MESLQIHWFGFDISAVSSTSLHKGKSNTYTPSESTTPFHFQRETMNTPKTYFSAVYMVVGQKRKKSIDKLDDESANYL